MTEDQMPAWAGAMQQALMGHIDAGQAVLLGRVEGLEPAIMARVDRELRRPLLEHIDSRTAAIMERIDRLQARVDSHADSLKVNFAAAQIARGKVAETEETLLQRELARTQEMRTMQDMIEAMQRQILRLETELDALRRGH